MAGFCVGTGRNRRSLHYATPDFLSSLVALASFMRLSLLKGAHAVLSSAAWQETRVRSVEKHSQEWSVELQIPRLALGMTKGRANACMESSYWTFITFVIPSAAEGI